MININSKTKIIGLLGYPLGFTFSPIMHNSAFEDKGINNIYIPIEVDPKNFETAVKALPSMNFGGCNITKPFKIEVIKYLDEIDELAERIGAVNTITIKDGKLKGYNTDGRGFVRSLEESMGSSVEGKRIFVLGSGGASRAICMILAMKKAEKLFICNRTYEKAVALSDDINKKVSSLCAAVPMTHSEMKKAIDDSDIFINTTSVGTFPNVDDTPIDKNLLNEKLIVCDVIYNPKKTKLIIEAEKLGCKTMSGLGMVVYQGAEAFELWTGVKAPARVMFDAVSKALGIDS